MALFGSTHVTSLRSVLVPGPVEHDVLQLEILAIGLDASLGRGGAD